jgi:hypothetical protein
MFESTLSFWICLGGFVLIGLWLLGAQAVRRRVLGKVLWAALLPARRWLALIWLVMAGLKIADVATGSATRHMGLNILLVGGFLLLPVIIVFGPTFSVHEGGICIGLLCFSWREVAGWSWGPAPGEMVSLNIQGRGRRGLCVWTSSRWRLFYQLRPQRPICTHVARDRDLEALLHKYAPQAERSSMAGL